MNKLLTASFIALVFLDIPVFAKPWRGITPLVSTRSEVERILGKPVRFSNHWGTYHTEKEAISILYSNGLPCRAGANSDWNVPEDRVIAITISPKEIVSFASLKVAESKFRSSEDPHRRNAIEYSNVEEGEFISVVNGEVTGFRYSADLASKHLECPKKTAESVMPAAPKFDSYGDLARADEESRLDNFAIALMQKPGAIGHIFSYSGGTITPSKARARARRAKNYVTKSHKLDSARVIAIYQGGRTDFTIELYIAPEER